MAGEFDFGEYFLGGLGNAAKTGLDVGGLAPVTGLTGAEIFGPTRGDLPGGLGANFLADPSIGMGVGGGAGSGIDWGGLIKGTGNVLGLASGIAQVPLAIAGLNVARRGQKALEQGERTAEAAAAPKIAAENRLLPAGTDALLGGKLPPELQQQVETQVNQAKQQLLQNLTRSGIDPQTAEAMIQGQLDQLRTQLTTQYAESILTGGMSVGTGGSEAIGAGQLGSQELQTANQALSGANQALNRVLAGAG